MSRPTAQDRGRTGDDRGRTAPGIEHPSTSGGCDCIVLAAGASRRMGQSKLYLRFGGRTLIETTVANARGAGLRVIVVARGEDGRIADLLGAEAVVVRNVDPERGMLSSLREGLRRVTAARFFFIPADMPLVGAGIYRAMAAVEAAGPVIPTSDGRRGHPVLMPSTLIPAIMHLADDVPLKTLIAAQGPTDVDIGDDAILRDIDTSQEYEAAVGRSQLAKQGNAPSPDGAFPGARGT
ncbi:MAG: NTP transferase domain-containing protein [Spirochaetia bacterium]